MPTRFTAANDDMLGLAGIWAPWTNPATSQIELSSAMLTLNADDHTMFKLMHRPDPKRPPEEQDKRMVVIFAGRLIRGLARRAGRALVGLHCGVSSRPAVHDARAHPASANAAFMSRQCRSGRRRRGGGISVSSSSYPGGS